MPSNEVDVLLTLSALNRGQIQSVKRAAALFNVPKTTLRRRAAGVNARRDCQPNSRKLTELKEEVIIGHILNLASRGFPPSLNYVRNMADRLLAARSAGQVGKLWLNNFVKRTARLTTYFSRPYDRQRALCENPVGIKG